MLSELDEMIDDVIFLLEGRIAFQGPLVDLSSLTGEARLERAIAALMRANAR